ncbi:MAG: hypothetical protein ACLFUJ_09555 [Phycisphaerae bacterium]
MGQRSFRPPTARCPCAPLPGSACFRSARRGRYKVVCFRDCSPLAFDLRNDSEEHHNLLDRPAEQIPAELTDLLEETRRSIDFDQAAEKLASDDARLRGAYPHVPGPKPGNCYILPDGRVVDADRAIYRPELITDDPAATFADWPGLGGD